MIPEEAIAQEQDKIKDVMDKAVTDALLYGIGVVLIQRDIIKNDLEMCHVPPEQYMELTDALEFAHKNIDRSLPKQ